MHTSETQEGQEYFTGATHNKIAVFCAIYLEAVLLVPGGWLLLHHEWKQITLLAVAVVLARGVLCELVYLFYHKQRPYQRLGFTPPSSWFFSPIWKRFDSFPSGHAAALASAAAVLFPLHPMLGLSVFSVAVVTSIARVLLGYHYTSDVVAGIIIGATAGYSVFLAAVPWLFTT